MRRYSQVVVMASVTALVMLGRAPFANAQIAFPGGVEDFEALGVGDDVSLIPDWFTVNTSANPLDYTVLAADDVLSVVGPRGASTRWLRVTDVDASDVQNRFYSGNVVAPSALDYKWTFYVNLETVPPGAGAGKPRLTIQHLAPSFANVWGIEFADTGASLIVIGNGGPAGSAPLYSLASPTDVGDWVKLEMWVAFSTNTIAASVNDGPVVSLPINLIGDPNTYRFCYRGEGPGNAVTMLIDDVTLETAQPCCLANDSCTLLVPDICIQGGGTPLPGAADCLGDSDGDGVDASCGDGCPNDPNKTAPGACGCNATEADSDGDGVPDCNDQCPGLDDAIPGCQSAIPAASEWGLLALALSLMVLAKVGFGQRRATA